MKLPTIGRPPATVEDVRRLARKRLPRLAFDFIDGGADAELTLRGNAEAFELRTLRPRQLVGVETRDLSTTVLGVPVRMPVMIAPTGMSRVAGRGGDVAGARAAGRAGTVFSLSTMSSDSIEDVARRRGRTAVVSVVPVAPARPGGADDRPSAARRLPRAGGDRRCAAGGQPRARPAQRLQDAAADRTAHGAQHPATSTLAGLRHRPR